KVGVTFTPALFPSARSFLILDAVGSLSRHCVNFVGFNASVFACCVQSLKSRVSWSRNSLLCMTQNFPCSPAQIAASAALKALGWLSKVKLRKINFTLPVKT